MIDRTAALLKGLDAPRAVPAPARMRLVSALEVESIEPVPENLRAILDRPLRLPAGMQARIESMLVADDDADIVQTMWGIDAPVDMSPMARARLERRLAAEMRRRNARLWQMMGAAAAAVLVLVGAVLITRPGSEPAPGDRQARPDVIVDTTEPPSAGGPVKPVEPPKKDQPRQRVLGAREVRPTNRRDGAQVSVPVAGAPLDQAGTTQPDGAGAPGRRSAPGQTLPQMAPSGGLTLLDPVTALLSQVLKVLQGQPVNLDDLADISKSSPPAAPAPAASPAAPPTRSRARSARAPSRARPAATTAAAPAAQKQQSSSLVPSVTTAVNGIVQDLVDVSVLSTDVAPVVPIKL